MRLLRWFASLFDSPLDTPAPRLVKFVEGTEWLCPHCDTLIAVARHDIFVHDIARSSDWDVKDKGFWDLRHCGEHLFGYSVGSPVGRRIWTPTGWVG